MNVKLIRLYGLFGIITPILGFFMIFSAISTAPWFSWQENALSDLGVEGLTAAIFNKGLMMTAAIMAIFALGTYELGKKDWLGKTGSITLICACIFLAAIGLFPETSGRIHREFSIAFFVTLPVAVIIIAVSLIQKGHKELGAVGIVAGSVAISVWTLSGDGIAIPEAVSAASTGVWSIVTGTWMTRYVEQD